MRCRTPAGKASKPIVILTWAIFRCTKAVTRSCSQSSFWTLHIPSSSSRLTPDFASYVALPRMQHNPMLILYLGHQTREEQRRWLWYRFLYGPETRGGAVPIYVDHTSMELHQLATNRIQDCLATDFCPCTSHHRRLPLRGQLPPFHAWEPNVDAQRWAGRVEVH